MFGIGLIAVGVLLIVTGIIIVSSSSENKTLPEENNNLEEVIAMAISDGVLTKNETQLITELAEKKGLNSDEVIKEAKAKMASLNLDAETTLVDHKKQKGENFEKFIAQKFNKKYFKIKEWAGDKFVNGVYAENSLHPDLLLEFKLHQEKATFSVECKWRQNLYKGGFSISEQQLKRYQQYEKKKEIPVFVTIGIGGKASLPQNLYIIPLAKMTKDFLHLKDLKPYKKEVDSKFFFDIKSGELK